MKRITTLGLCLILILLLKNVSFAAPVWEISARQWESGGSLDYLFFYPYSSQVESRVTFPQNQSLLLVGLRHNFEDGRRFIYLEYGGSSPGFKGRGSDSDWTIYGEDTLTYYGEMDGWGRVNRLTVDGGTLLARNDMWTVTLFGGWSRQESDNELKNVIYHLIDGEDVGNRTQPDNGSRFDGVLSGYHFGIGNNLELNPRIHVNMKTAVSVLSARAYGHWANHDPAWDWVDTGNGLGFSAGLGMEYAFGESISANIGYDYFYANFPECKEVLDGEPLAESVGLRYEQAGIFLGVSYRF